MHMIATNLCVWIKVVVAETVREIKKHYSLYYSQHINPVPTRTLPVLAEFVPVTQPMFTADSNAEVVNEVKVIGQTGGGMPDPAYLFSGTNNSGWSSWGEQF